jgi:NAD(P)-dependent dehydrogenase (short-subunit alcohol dehydrogenase family)
MGARLHGKAALVTGATSNIGRAIAAAGADAGRQCTSLPDAASSRRKGRHPAWVIRASERRCR